MKVIKVRHIERDISEQRKTYTMYVGSEEVSVNYKVEITQVLAIGRWGKLEVREFNGTWYMSDIKRGRE